MLRMLEMDKIIAEVDWARLTEFRLQAISLHCGKP